MVELNEQIAEKEKLMGNIDKQARSKEEYLKRLNGWLSANIENKNVRKWLFEEFIPNYDLHITALSKLFSKELIKKLEGIKRRYKLLFKLSQTKSVVMLHNSKNDLEFFEDSYDVLSPQIIQNLLNKNIVEFDKWFRSYISHLYSLFDKSMRLLKEVVEAKETKRLLRYQKEVEFFEKLHAELTSAKEEKTWKGFLLLYKHGKGHIERIEKEFGDTAAVERIQKELTKGGEDRERFVKVVLPQMINELKSQDTILKIEEGALLKLRGAIGRERDSIRKLVDRFEKDIKKAFEDEIKSIKAATNKIESEDAVLNEELVKHFEELEKLEVIENEIIGLFAKANAISKWRMGAIGYIEGVVKLGTTKWQNPQTLEQLKKYSAYMNKAVDMEESACKKIGTDVKAIMRMRGFVKTNERFNNKIAGILKKVKESAPNGSVSKIKTFK